MIKDKIDKDIIEAMKQHSETALTVLRMLKSSIKNSEIQKQKELDESDILGVIQSQIKSRKDSIELYKQGGRMELAQKEQDEIDILAKYLPEQMGETEIRDVILKAIQETGATSMQDMGKVMGKIMPETKGRADSSLVSQIVKEELSK
jgi:uncharacterized protein YqeY